VNVGSGVPKVCGKVALAKPFGVKATGLPLNGVVPSRKVIVPVGLVVMLVGWTVAVSATVPPTVMVDGLAVTVVVAVPVPL
jgi:hypothetical protein